MSIFFDLRPNARTGIMRVGLQWLQSLSTRDSLGPIHVGVWSADKAYVQERSGLGRRASFHPLDDDAYLRSSQQLADFIHNSDVQFYFTSHYLAPLDLPVPFAFTIHDLLHVALPSQSYTEAQLQSKLSLSDRRQMRGYLEAKSVTLNGSLSRLFRDYHRYYTDELLRKATAVFTVSVSTARQIHRTYGPHSHIRIVRPSVPALQANHSHRLDVLRLTDGRRYILALGPARPHKNLQVIADAFARAKAEALDSKLVLVNVQSTDVDEPDVVRLGYVGDGTLCALYSAASAYVSASSTEGFGLPTVEALSQRTPVIASDIPTARELLRSRAHMFPVGDIEALAKLMLCALRGELDALQDAPVERQPQDRSFGDELGALLAPSEARSTV